LPYIKQENRDRFNNNDIDSELFNGTVTAGDLNYIFTRIAHNYIIGKGKESYQAYNDIIGALEGCKLELYRKKIAPYENKKINENGDI